MTALSILGASGVLASASLGDSAPTAPSDATESREPQLVTASSVGSAAEKKTARDAVDAASEAIYRSAARTLERGKRYSDVVKSLDALVRKYPFSPKYNAALGIAYAGEALASWAGTLPDSPPSRNFGEQEIPPPPELLDRGIQRLEALIRIYPDTPEYHFLVGWIYLANARAGIDSDTAKSRKLALEAFQSAIRLNPSELTYYQALGDFYRLNPGISGSDGASAGSSSKDSAASRLAGVASSSSTAEGAKAKRDASLAIEAYRKVSRARPKDAGLHFALYQLYDKAGDADRADEELQLTCRYDRTNAAPFYLLAQSDWTRSDASRGQSAEIAWHEAAIEALRGAMSAPDLDLAVYRPDYPSLMAPALQLALGDSLTPETLEIHKRLKALADRILTEGDLRQGAGDPGGGEEFYNSAYSLGERLTNAAMSASQQYLLRLPELTAGLTVQESALNALRSLYEKYSMEDRLAELRQRRIALDQIRQMASRGAEIAAPASSANGSE